MELEVPKRASDGYENVLTLVGIADVFINELGHVWNTKARKEPHVVQCLADDLRYYRAPFGNCRAVLYETLRVSIP